MNKEKKPSFPVNKSWRALGTKGEICIVDISVEQTSDKNKYPPDGVKSVFRVLKLGEDGLNNIVVLIDNHGPFGFHEHTNLPNQEPRSTIEAINWQEAWIIFEKKMKEIFP